MRVAFGVSALAAGMQQGGIDGIGSVARELLGRLQSSADVEVLPYEFAHIVSGEIPGTLAVGSFQRQALCSLVAPCSFPVMCRALHGRVDLVHATDHLIPRLRGTPVLATLMDAIPLSHPKWVAYRFRALKNVAWQRSAHWADHVLTISEFSRREIARHFRIPESRISVIPLGVDERWFNVPSDEDWQRVRAAYALPDQYFLAVGTLQPRKNLECLLQAHEALPEDVRHHFPLLIVGRDGWGCEALVSRLRAGTQPHVRWLNYVPRPDLPVLLSRATALLFPSLHEGFGLPVLEGFAAGTPVVAANTTSIPEVAGDAAILADPLDWMAWRDQMLKMTGSPDGIEERIRLGRQRARLFSWSNTVRELTRLYVQVAGSHTG